MEQLKTPRWLLWLTNNVFFSPFPLPNTLVSDGCPVPSAVPRSKFRRLSHSRTVGLMSAWREQAQETRSIFPLLLGRSHRPRGVAQGWLRAPRVCRDGPWAFPANDSYCEGSGWRGNPGREYAFTKSISLGLLWQMLLCLLSITSPSLSSLCTITPSLFLR